MNSHLRRQTGGQHDIRTILLIILAGLRDRRRILHFNVTAHPTAEWVVQQLREAFPFAELPRYLLRDRDAIFGHDFQEQVRDIGICEVLSAPRSPSQESLCRARHWLRSSGVPRSCDRVPRKLATKNAPVVLRVLPPIENASFVGKGRAGATSDSAAGNGDRRGRSAGRRAA